MHSPQGSQASLAIEVPRSHVKQGRLSRSRGGNKVIWLEIIEVPRLQQHNPPSIFRVQALAHATHTIQVGHSHQPFDYDRRARS